MKNIIVILIASLCFISIADAKPKKNASKDLLGTIVKFECGDNCYLTIVDNKGTEHTALCTVDPLCEKLMTATGDNLGGYKGKKVKVVVGTGQQLDGSGTVMGTMDSFVKIQLLK